jgi:hypothetical protein
MAAHRLGEWVFASAVVITAGAIGSPWWLLLLLLLLLVE